MRLALLLLATCSCASYAGVAVSPTGVVWIVRNASGSGGAVAMDVLACTQRDGALACSKVPVRVAGE